MLHTVEDFDDLMWAYLQRAHADGMRRAEIFFDPQVHTERGIAFEVFMDGFARARQRAAAELGITTALIMCFLRHLPESAALATLDAAGPYLDQIAAVGLDSSEVGHPPSEFQRVFATAGSGVAGGGARRGERRHRSTCGRHSTSSGLSASTTVSASTPTTPRISAATSGTTTGRPRPAWG